MNVFGIVLLVASDFDLLKPPLRKRNVCRAQVTVQVGVSEPHSSRQRVNPLDLALLSGKHIVDDFHDPVVVAVPDTSISVAGHLIMVLCHGSRDGVGMQVSPRRGVDKPDYTAILEELEWCIGIVVSFIPGWGHDEVVVVVLVVITSDLLLIRSYGKRLNMRMQQSTSIAEILNRNLGSDSNFERRFCKVVASQMSLEQRAHLRVTGTGTVQDHKVELEAEGVDAEWNQNETKSSRYPVLEVGHLAESRRISSCVLATNESWNHLWHS